MGEKSLLDIYGPATDDDEFLDQIPDDDVDEEALAEWLATQKDADDTEDTDETTDEPDGEYRRQGRVKVFNPRTHIAGVWNDDCAGQPVWSDMEMYVKTTTGKKSRFAPLALATYLYQAHCLSIRDNDLYFLWDDFDSPLCDGIYRYGDDALMALLREKCWANAPERSLVEVVNTCHRFMLQHQREFRPNQNAYICEHVDGGSAKTILIIDPDTGEIEKHDGYVDPALQVTGRYQLGVTWRDTWDYTDHDQRAAMDLVEHLVDGVTGDNPELALRLMQQVGTCISLNKSKAGVPVQMSYDRLGARNGGNGKSTFWLTIADVFGRVIEVADLEAMFDNTGLARVKNKLAWYVDESTPHVDDKTTAKIKSLSLGGHDSANIKFEKHAANIEACTFVLSSNFQISFGSKNTGEAVQRRIQVQPYLADVEHGPHSVPQIRDRIAKSELAREYLLYMAITARQVFVRNGFAYQDAPKEYGDLAKKMLDATSPVELWLLDVGEDILTGYHADWDAPRLIETCAKGKTQRWMSYPVHMAKVAREYHKRVAGGPRVAHDAPYVVEASGLSSTAPIGTEVRAVLANDKALLFAQFATWCAETNMMAPGATTWARLVMQRDGTHVVAVGHVSTQLGTRTLMLRPNEDDEAITLDEAISEAQAARDALKGTQTEVAPVTGMQAPSMTDSSFEKVRRIAFAMRDIDHIEATDGVVTVSDFTASIITHAVLSAFGVIPDGSKLAMRTNALDLSDISNAAPEIQNLVAQLIA